MEPSSAISVRTGTKTSSLRFGGSAHLLKLGRDTYYSFGETSTLKHGGRTISNLKHRYQSRRLAHTVSDIVCSEAFYMYQLEVKRWLVFHKFPAKDGWDVTIDIDPMERGKKGQGQHPDDKQAIAG